VNIKQAITSGYRNSFRIKGRASRSEYWYFVLFYVVIDVVFQIFSRHTVSPGRTGSASLVLLLIDMALALVVIASLVPLVAVEVRRVHDSGRSGWWIGATVIYSLSMDAIFGVEFFRSVKAHDVGPFLGSIMAGDHMGLIIGLVGLMALSIAVFIFTVLPGTSGDNPYGPNPLTR